MKRKKTLLGMLGVLALAVIALVVVSNRSPKTTNAEETISVKLGSEDLTAFTVGDLSFEKTGEDWLYAQDPIFPLDQDKAQAMVEEIGRAHV